MTTPDTQAPPPSYQRKTLFFFLFILGLGFSVLLFVLILELVALYPPKNVQQLLIDHAATMSTIPIAPETIGERIREKLHFYQELSSQIWVSWAVMIAGFLLTALSLILGMKDTVVQNHKSRAVHFQDLFNREKRRKKKADDEIAGLETHLNDIHDHLNEGFIELDRQEKIIRTNQQSLILFASWGAIKRQTRDLDGENLAELLPGYISSGLSLAVQDCLNRNNPSEREYFLEPLDTWVLVRLFPSRGAAYMYFRDISDEKKPDHLLKLSEKLMRQLSGHAPLAFAVTDRQWNYLMASKLWQKNFQLEGTDITGKSHKQLLPNIPGKWDKLEKHLNNGEVIRSEETMFHLNGQEEWLKWEIRPWKDTHGTIAGYLMFAEVVTESVQQRALMKDQRQREHMLAYHDVLTGLPNRQLFYDRLNMSLAQAYRQLGRVGLMFLDLDGFKAINDNLGHDAGDLLLKEVANRLKGCVRETDTVARLGGDEFTVILNGVPDNQAITTIANKIIQRLAEPIDLGSDTGHVTTSIGISAYPTDGSSAADLIKKADMAMYWSKEGGKNRYTFYKEKTVTPEANDTNGDKEAPSAAEAEMAQQLKAALGKGEMDVVYQPLYRLDNHKVFGMEALLRWHHPQLGLLTPPQFLDLAEQSGHILPIGAWVLEQACARNMQWQEQGNTPIQIHVNFSARQLDDEALAKRVQDILEKTGQPAETLAIEFSESILMDHTPVMEENLRLLKDMGCKLVVDDFGIGYSPMSSLRTIPLDMLKIHNSFIQHIETSSEDQALIRSIIALAINLKLAVLAEAVETTEQEEFLRSNGCPYAQGFMFAEPMEPRQLQDFFDSHTENGGDTPQ